MILSHLMRLKDHAMTYILTADTELGLLRFWSGNQWTLFEEEAKTFETLEAAILYCRVLKRFDAEVSARRTDAYLVCVITCPHGMTLDLPCWECDTPAL